MKEYFLLLLIWLSLFVYWLQPTRQTCLLYYYDFFRSVCLVVVQQNYDTEVNNVYVIRKNSAILKCSIPSFVADFVTVVSWHDEEGGNYYMDAAKGTI